MIHIPCLFRFGFQFSLSQTMDENNLFFLNKALHALSQKKNVEKWIRLLWILRGLGFGWKRDLGDRSLAGRAFNLKGVILFKHYIQL